MIGQISGKLSEKQPPDVVVDVHGVGYEITCSMPTIYQLPAVGEQVRLCTHFIVREDAQILFGFHSKHERALFRALIKVNGIGPRLALAILSSLDPQQFADCLVNNDASMLVKVPGVGKKTAERLIIEMRDKMSAWTETDSDSLSPKTISAVSQVSNDPRQEATGALLALGYRSNDVTRLLNKVYQSNLSCEALIRLALREVAA